MKGLIKKNKIPVVEMIFIGFLPSFLKKNIYRLKGYKIGKDVRIGLGSVIIGKNVTIGDHTKIGFITVIRGRKIHLERFVTIGSLTMIDSEQIIIDEDARINENVIIGGTKTPDSLIKIGKRVIIMEYSFINPTKSIIIGDDSGIGGHCLLFTHGSWLNQLDGFPVTFAPINIGKNVWLPWRVFVMPGVTIGDNVVIGAQSLITTDLPSNVLAAGSPAKVIKENYPKKISEEKRQELIAQIIVEFKTYLEYNAVHTKQDNFNEGSILIVNKKNKNQRLLFLNKIPKSDFLMKKTDLLVIDCKTESKFDAKMILDLQNKTRTGSSPLGEEFSKYLSRHGIRFNRLD